MFLEQNVVGVSLCYRAGELLANHFKDFGFGLNEMLYKLSIMALSSIFQVFFFVSVMFSKDVLFISQAVSEI